MEKLPQNLLLSFAESFSITELNTVIFPLKLKFGKVVKSDHPISCIKQPEITYTDILNEIAISLSESEVKELQSFREQDNKQQIPFITSYNKFNSKNNRSEMIYFKYADDRELYIEQVNEDHKKRVG